MKPENSIAVKLLGSALQRTRGLLGQEPHELTVLLVPCSDVHTFGMKHNIDVAFVDVQGVVMEVYSDVGPRRRLRRRGAAGVLERFSQNSSWVQKGDRVVIKTERGKWK